MTLRELLSSSQREAIDAIPVDRAGLIEHYVLNEADLNLIRQRRGNRNRLGFAVQLALLRFPGRVLKRPGKRTSDWLKIKARLQQEFVVGGFTAPKGSRKYLGAVVLGAYTDGKLRHYGYAGSGFSEKGLKDAVARMKPLFIDKCPFVNPPNIKEKIQWVRPTLVCEVEYAELTADDQLRQTTFLGWRDDKKAKDVVLELTQTA